MKRYCNLILLVLLGMLLGVGCGGCAAMKGHVPPVVKQELRIKLSNSELIAMEGGSTVALMGYRDDKETTVTTGFRPYCTGVWVDTKHILTANHCVEGELEWQQDRLDERKQKQNTEGPMTLQQLLQKLFGGGDLPEADKVEKKGLKIHYIVEKEVMGVAAEPSAWHLSKVAAWDEEHDLALLEVVGQLQPPHTIARLAKETPDLGEHVNVVGHQTGLYWTYMGGQVAAYRDEDHYKRLSVGRDDAKGPYMQVQMPIFYGNSGGGCFNDYGELVGIAVRITRAPEVGFFVHRDTIASFLDKNK